MLRNIIGWFQRPKLMSVVTLLTGFVAIVFTSEVFSNPNSVSCEEQLEQPGCVTDFIELPPFQVEGPFTVWIQATQAIVREEVEGDGYAADVLKLFGTNHVPGYPTPDAFEIFASKEFKTHNKIAFSGVVRGDGVEVDKSTTYEHELGRTSVLFTSIPGTVLANVFRSSNDELRPRVLGSGQRIGFCFFGAIHRALALANFGRRLAIGSEVGFQVVATGDRATITPMVRHSVFPTTFMWAGETVLHDKARPIRDVLGQCETFE